MKIIVWSLTLSMALGLTPPSFRFQEARAEVVTNTVNTQNPSGQVNTPTVITGPNQTQAQQNTQKENNDGAN
jgi:hypothetical protein